jgi:hypothetical protein
VDEFIDKINEVEAKYELVPEMSKARSKSADRVLLDHEDYFAVSDSDLIKGIQDPANPLIHPLKKRNRQYLRVHSQPRLPSYE